MSDGYFRIYCETDDKWEYLWHDVDVGITQCPENNAHTVSLDGVSPQQLVEDANLIKIKEETAPEGALPTGGHYMAESIVIDVETGVTASIEKSFPYPIGLIDVIFTTEDNMKGDELLACMACDTIIGTLIEDVEPGVTATDYGFKVSDTVSPVIERGYDIKLYDGVNQNDLGKVKKVHICGPVKDRLIVTKEPTDTFLASSPTYVQMTIPMVNLTFGPAQTYNLGQNTVGGQYIPADTVGKFIYKNNEGSAKKLYVTLEYFY